jgi:hypothetical protein
MIQRALLAFVVVVVSWADNAAIRQGSLVFVMAAASAVVRAAVAWPGIASVASWAEAEAIRRVSLAIGVAAASWPGRAAAVGWADDGVRRGSSASG